MGELDDDCSHYSGVSAQQIGSDSWGKAIPLHKDDKPSTSTKSSANQNSGHRERLRARFISGGMDALADYEILELFLFRSMPRRDTKPVAKALLAQFGNLTEVLSAPRTRLMEVKGVGEAVATDLQIIKLAAQALTREQARQREVLSSWSAVMDYCRAMMAHENKEQFRLLFLDKKNQLISDEVQQVGTVDHTPVYPREVVKRALELSATALILVHNHPSGDPTPSAADIQMTDTLVKLTNGLGIVIHDHIIVSRTSHASFRQLGLIDDKNI